MASARSVGLMVAASFLVFAGGLTAAELPKATQAVLRELKLEAGILSGLDGELAVPDAWVAAAQKERALKITGSWDPAQFTKLSAPFRERYPFIRLEYSRSSFAGRALRPLIALKEGRFITDILTGFGGSVHHYQQADALDDLRLLPGFKNPILAGSDPGGAWVGTRMRYWCMIYNTNLVPAADLPKTWEDLIDNPRWHGGKIGVSNRPQLWVMMLYGEYGERWVENYLERFFSIVKPQLRQEGQNALGGLVNAGEFHAALPGAAYRTKQYQQRGAPAAWHCPEPVPLAVSEMGILKGSPNLHAARLFANWFLSKEGQVSQFFADFAPPVHKDLQTEFFLSYPEQVTGRKIAFRGPEAEEDNDKLYAIWNRHWEKAGGKPPKQGGSR